MAGTVAISTHYLPPKNLGSPALAIQVIHLVDSYMIWVGATDVMPEDVDKAMLHGKLCKDWACALPGKNEGTAVGTSLFRSGRTDAALSMAQRLGESLETKCEEKRNKEQNTTAQRFQKTIYVSVDTEEDMLREAEIGIKSVIGRSST